MKKQYDDISGKRYGRILVISYAGTKTVGIKSKQTQSVWNCQCDCGVTKVIAAHDLKRGSTVSCGCQRAENRSSRPRHLDITGNRYGRLVALKHAGTVTIGTKTKSQATWLCQCDCGGSKVVPLQRLKNKLTQSCGCLVKEANARRVLPPGHTPRKNLLRHYQARALERKQRWALTDEHAFWLFEQNCHYCGKEPSLKIHDRRNRENVFTYNTIDRVGSSLGYLPYNCVPACLRCNNQKQDKEYLDYFEWLKKQKAIERTS